MNIVNIIYIGDQTYRMDELSEEKQREIGILLNKQALEAIEYKIQQDSAKQELEELKEKLVRQMGILPS